MVRLFFALWPALDAAEVLGRWSAEAAQWLGGRATRPDTLHLTLVFLGKVPESEVPQVIAVANAIRRPRFEVLLDQVGYWPHNQLLWAGCSRSCPPLTELVAELREGLSRVDLGDDESGRAFVPHVTLLRKLPGLPDLAGLPTLAPVCWPVHDFVLVRSAPGPTGPDYRVLARFALAA